MTFDQLKYFYEAAQQEHIGLAAKRLNISPSAISHSVRSLETELGKPLFEKKGKRVFLTSHGRVLKVKAEAILAQASALFEEMSREDVTLMGHYRIAATHYFCENLLTPAVAEVQKRHPKLSVELVSSRSGEIVTKLATGELDFGLLLAPLESNEVDFETLFDMDLLFAARKSHPLVLNPSVKKLNEYPMAAPQTVPGILSCEHHPFFPEHGIEPNVTHIYTTYSSAVNLLAKSDFWSLIPSYVIERNKRKISPIQIKGWKASISVAVGRPRAKLETRVLRELKQAICREIEQY